jgi:NADPH2:quinone reductase
MSKSILIHENGGPEKMKFEEVEVGAPGPGQVKIRHTAIGLNFIDVYTRSGLYQTPLPNAVGREGAGVVVEVGPKVRGFKKGDRVAYCGVLGAYCQERVMGVDQLVHVPKGVSDEQAAAMMLKGMTTEYLVDHTPKGWLKKGDTILFHAAAGGVGLIACQWARALGATVIGTVGTEEKAKLARAHGCHHVIVYTRERFVDRVKEITGGGGVRAAYDSVGRDTYLGSLECLQPLGMLALFGQSSGPVPPLELALLSRASLFVTRPSLFHYVAARADLVAAAAALFDVVRSGAVRVEVRQSHPLKDAAQAHRDLEARRTTGSTVLLP